jgi:hypothetical protein
LRFLQRKAGFDNKRFWIDSLYSPQTNLPLTSHLTLYQTHSVRITS